jgi:hypothetical protein
VIVTFVLVQSFWGVFDGHGSVGHEVSEYVKQHLHEFVSNHLDLVGTKHATVEEALSVRVLLCAAVCCCVHRIPMCIAVCIAVWCCMLLCGPLFRVLTHGYTDV